MYRPPTTNDPEQEEMEVTDDTGPEPPRPSSTVSFDISHADTVFASMQDVVDHVFQSGPEDELGFLPASGSQSLTLYKSEPLDQEDQPLGGPELSETYDEAQEQPDPFFQEFLVKTEPEEAPAEGSGDEEDQDGSASSSSSSGDDEEFEHLEDEGEENEEGEVEEGSVYYTTEDGTLIDPADLVGGDFEFVYADDASRAAAETGEGEEELEGGEQEAEEEEAEVTEGHARPIDDEELSLDYFVQGNIENYLSEKGFRTEMEVPKEIPKGTFASIIQPETARAQAITFGPQYDWKEIPRAVERFWKFYSKLKEEVPKLGSEFRPLLVPILVSFYTDLFFAGRLEPAIRLYNEFSQRFLTEDETKESYQILCNIAEISGAPEEFHAREYLEGLRSRSRQFVLSSAAFERLKTFLSSTTGPQMLHLFSSRFVIQLEESAASVETFLEAPVRPGSEPVPAFRPRGSSFAANPPTPKEEDRWSPGPLHKEGNEDDDSGTELTPAREALYFLRNSVEANVPSLTLHTMSDTPICGAMSLQGTLMAFGMTSSEIRVCFSSDAAVEAHNWTRRQVRRREKVKKGSGVKRKIDEAEVILDEDEEPESSSQDEAEVQRIVVMAGHEGPVQALAFHPRTKLLYSVGQDSTMRAWDLNTFKCRTIYKGHTAPVWCMDIAGTGHMIVTGSMDTTARVWLPESTEYVRLLAGHYFDVDCVKFHPNEAYVATGSVDKSVRLWSVSDGNMVRVFTGSTAGVSTLDFHRDGKHIIGGGEDSVIRIWDIADSEVVAELPAPGAASVRDISLCSHMLAAAFEDNNIRIWNLRQLFGGNGRLVVEDDVETDGTSSASGSAGSSSSSSATNSAESEDDEDEWTDVSSADEGSASGSEPESEVYEEALESEASSSENMDLDSDYEAASEKEEGECEAESEEEVEGDAEMQEEPEDQVEAEAELELAEQDEEEAEGDLELETDMPEAHAVEAAQSDSNPDLGMEAEGDATGQEAVERDAGQDPAEHEEMAESETVQETAEPADEAGSEALLKNIEEEAEGDEAAEALDQGAAGSPEEGQVPAGYEAMEVDQVENSSGDEEGSPRSEQAEQHEGSSAESEVAGSESGSGSIHSDGSNLSEPEDELFYSDAGSGSGSAHSDLSDRGSDQSGEEGSPSASDCEEGSAHSSDRSDQSEPEPYDSENENSESDYVDVSPGGSSLGSDQSDAERSGSGSEGLRSGSESERYGSEPDLSGDEGSEAEGSFAEEQRSGSGSESDDERSGSEAEASQIESGGSETESQGEEEAEEVPEGSPPSADGSAALSPDPTEPLPEVTEKENMDVEHDQKEVPAPEPISASDAEAQQDLPTSHMEVDLDLEQGPPDPAPLVDLEFAGLAPDPEQGEPDEPNPEPDIDILEPLTQELMEEEAPDSDLEMESAAESQGSGSESEDEQSSGSDYSSAAQSSVGSSTSASALSSSSSAVTEEELEPLLTRTRNQLENSSAVRIPTPRIIPCESSSLLRLYYRDLGHLLAFGRQSLPPPPPGPKVPQPEPDPDPPAPDPQPVHLSSLNLNPASLTESLRALFQAAGLDECPIPEESSTFDADLACLLGIPDEEALPDEEPPFDYQNLSLDPVPDFFI